MKYSEAKLKILRLLNDAEGTVYSNEIILDGVSSALDAVLPWIPRLQQYVIDPSTSGSPGPYYSGLTELDISYADPLGNQLFNMPSDCYEIQTVSSLDGELIPNGILGHGHYHGDLAQINDWIEYPTGILRFGQRLLRKVEVFYLATWPKPVNDTDDLLVPSRYNAGIIFYSAAYCLVTDSVQAAKTRQYNMKVDSGRPSDNPPADQVSRFHKLFIEEMNRYPAYQKAMK